MENDITKIEMIYDILDSKKSLDDYLKENFDINNTGAVYYLINYLPEFFKGYKQNEIEADYVNGQLTLENEFREMIIPNLMEQRSYDEERKKHENGYCYLGEGGHYFEYMAKLTLSRVKLKSIIDKLASISLQKIADKKPITTRDYGYIINKIALYVGDFNENDYNMLFVGFLHEITTGENYGSCAEKYLNDTLRKTAIISEELIGEGLSCEDSKKTKRL